MGQSWKAGNNCLQINKKLFLENSKKKKIKHSNSHIENNFLSYKIWEKKSQALLLFLYILYQLAEILMPRTLRNLPIIVWTGGQYFRVTEPVCQTLRFLIVILLIAFQSRFCRYQSTQNKSFLFTWRNEGWELHCPWSMWLQGNSPIHKFLLLNKRSTTFELWQVLVVSVQLIKTLRGGFMFWHIPEICSPRSHP